MQRVFLTHDAGHMKPHQHPVHKNNSCFEIGMERLLRHQSIFKSAKENPLVNIPDLSNSNYMTSSIKFFPQRVKYPSSIPASNEAGYNQALQFLGGPDAVLTPPLWWAKH